MSLNPEQSPAVAELAAAHTEFHAARHAFFAAAAASLDEAEGRLDRAIERLAAARCVIARQENQVGAMVGNLLVVLDRIQQAADEHPFNHLGHVIEHVVGRDRFDQACATAAEVFAATAANVEVHP